MRKELTIQGKRITLHGNEKNVARCEELLESIKIYLVGREDKDRLVIQENVCDKVRCSILYEGNSVHGIKTIMNDFDKLFKEGGMSNLTDELYDFFHLNCGTIAHYNREGWIGNYSSIGALRDLFMRNEYGQDVYSHIPSWKTDCKEIVLKMESKLGMRG